MKAILGAGILILAAANANAAQIQNDREKAQVNVARVTQIIPLVTKSDLRVSISVYDLGGSTDFAPTQEVFFTLYSKGEMFSTDAAFDLGPAFSVKSAKRISGGIYAVQAEIPNENGMPILKTLKIDAIKAITEMKNVRCDDFDCESSSKFKSSITVNSSKGSI